jgi:hypothetical protein
MPQHKDPDAVKPATETVCLPPGRIMQQMPGTMAWGADGRPLGIVGRDVPAGLVVYLFNGTVRPLTKPEARAFARWRGRS